jgi:hypothetical protein
MAQDAHEAELRALRLSAEQGDWNGCVDMTEKLLRRLPASRAVMLVRELVTRRLPLFERHQPGVRWPREFVESIQGTQPMSDGRIWPEAEDDFPGPGANSITSAVEHLWRASRLVDDAHQRIDELGSAVACAILAETGESWGARHPEEWALWYQLASVGSSDPRVTDTLIAIKRDPESVRLTRAAWLEVAERLEEALSSR